MITMEKNLEYWKSSGSLKGEASPYTFERATKFANCILLTRKEKLNKKYLNHTEKG